jgi:rRNA maturation endonuclease Nob1
VIKDGVNGFLCEAGDIKNLSETIIKINKLSIQEKKEISNNAILTASKLTNFKAANNYLNSLNLL